MDDKTYKTLEVDALLELLARHVQTPLGRRQVYELLPKTDPVEINRALERTTECVDYLKSGKGFGLSGIGDLESALAQLQVESTSLEPQQILALEHLITVGMDLRVEFRSAEIPDQYPKLAEIAAQVPDLRRLLESLRGKILPNGEIDDDASPELRRIRREMEHCRTRIHRALESILRGQARAIQEDIVTLRNGRFVVPIRSDSRGQVPGVVHGLSSSGQTTYVEPLPVIEQNNDLVRLHEQEETEIARILFSLSEALRSNLSGIRTIVQSITEIDFAQAKARLSLEFQCSRPQITSDFRLRLDEARHILLQNALNQINGHVVPISFELDDSHKVMVISGPNAGGKTVALKTTGLIVLMAQMGLHVPAREALLPVFEQTFADIGDQQSIAANLSTFTAHMRNISETARKIAPPALVLIDEVGTGTDPDEGAALAVAIVEHFRRMNATTIVTTHYNELKMWASQTMGVLNASVEFDTQTLRPTYRLIVGLAGASCGLDIAERIDVPHEIVDKARDLLDPAHSQATEYLKRLKSLVDEQEALRAALEEERQTTATKYAQLDLEFSKRESKRRSQFEIELERVIREFTAKSEQLIKAVDDQAEKARLKKHAGARRAALRRTASAHLEAHTERSTASSDETQTGPGSRLSARQPSFNQTAEALPGTSADIHEGDRVRVSPLGQEGTVESIHDNIYTVVIGSLRFRAKRAEVELLKHKEGPKPNQPFAGRGVSLNVSIHPNFPGELNVIGMTADEATERVDKFLDEAFLAEVDSVRIIHGHGKGVLRRAISELLTGHPQVESFYLAPPNQGGSGATIVNMVKD